MKVMSQRGLIVSRRVCLWAASVLVFAAGCPSSVPTDGIPVDAISAEAKQVVEDVAAQFTPTAEAVAVLLDALESIDFDGENTFEGCPTVTTTVAAGVFAITIDYGEGCIREFYGEDPASGSVTMSFDSQQQMLSFVYTDLVIGGRAVSGTLELALASEGDARNLAGAIDIVTNSGTVVGTIDLSLSLVEGSITFSEATLTLTDSEGTSIAVAVDSVAIKPIDHASFIPESGTMTFEVPNDGLGPETLTAVVTFSSQSPVDGTVTVTVGPAAPVTYQIGGAL